MIFVISMHVPIQTIDCGSCSQIIINYLNVIYHFIKLAFHYRVFIRLDKKRSQRMT